MRATLEAANARVVARRHNPAALEHRNDILVQGAAAIEAGRVAKLPALNTVFHAELARRT
jgi:DNA-binding GntR family transcriptional regulator